MLLSLLSQMVFQDEVILDLVYQRSIVADQQKIRSLSLLRELTEIALRTTRFCFVVVDALDECVGDQPARPETVQGEVIDWLESIMSVPKCNTEEEVVGEQDGRCMRLLIFGQRNGLLEERLRGYPAIQLDCSLSHMEDINAYSEAQSLRIQKKFDIDEDVRRGIMNRVTTRSKGQP